MVSSYALWLSNGLTALGEAWTLPAQPDAQRLELRLGPVALPPGAEYLAGAAVSPKGRGAVARVPLGDVVRSAPLAANFSGDEDPVELQIEGKVHITPVPWRRGGDRASM